MAQAYYHQIPSDACALTFKRHFEQEEVDQFQKLLAFILPFHLHSGEDKWFWRWGKNGCFFVKSSYEGLWWDIARRTSHSITLRANRAVEVDEMWRAREKELELDNKLSHRSKDTAKYGGERYHDDLSKESTSLIRGKPSADIPVSQSSRKHKHRDLLSEEYEGLKDEEVEEFLQSRMKRGRGAIGSRMDEPGPYPVCGSSDQDEQLLVTHESSAGDEGKRQVLGPKKPSWLLTDEQHKKSPGRNSAKEDRASRSKRRQSEDKYTHKKSKEKRRKDKSRHDHKN
ncbi:hypothetical protein Taro_025920 [Colocasia esculenta]|uniref:Uncharacterized protein n=1 Tax=Colocasia esculenta TaxID=4460 RepID=A0A843VA32_COLES|nr:hypothetical protein [Colocasia esculenta]